MQFGVSIEIISAQREAEFVFNGAMLCAASPIAPAMCVDMGGGSTEVCVGHGGEPTAVACIGLGSSKLVHSMPQLAGEGVADRGEMLECMQRVREHLLTVDVSAVREELVRPPWLFKQWPQFLDVSQSARHPLLLTSSWLFCERPGRGAPVPLLAACGAGALGSA